MAGWCVSKVYLKQYFVQRIDFQCNNNLPLFGWICAFCTKIHQHYPSIMQRYYRYRRESLGKFFTYFEKHFGFDYQLSLVPEGCIKITNQCTSSRPTSVIKFYFQPFPWCHFYHSMQDFYRSRWPRPRALRSGVIQSSLVRCDTELSGRVWYRAPWSDVIQSSQVGCDTELSDQSIKGCISFHVRLRGVNTLIRPR